MSLGTASAAQVQRRAAGMKAENRRGRTLRQVSAASLALGIFLADIFTPSDINFSALYVPVLLIAGSAAGRGRLWLWTAACLLLSTLAFFVGTEPGRDVSGDARFAIGITAIGCAALLISRQSKALATVWRQSQALDVAGSAILLRDHTGRIVLWNHAAEELYGWSPAEAIGQDAQALLDYRLPEALDAIMARFEQNGIWEGEVGHRRKNGGYVTVLSRWTYQREEGGLLPLIVEANVDAHAQRAAEALRLSELRYRTIFDTLAVAICEYDFQPAAAALAELRANGVSDLAGHLAAHPALLGALRRAVRITDANDTAVQMLGASSKATLFETLDDLLSETDESFADCLAALNDGKTNFLAETKIRTAAGEQLPVIMALSFPPGAELGRVTGCLVDLGDRLRMQATIDRTRSELENALRVASLGELSASIAHEVNQPLSAVMNFANAGRRWINRDPPDLDEARAALGDVIVAAQHASDVVLRIRKLLGKVAPERAPIQLDAMIAETVRMVQDAARIEAVSINLELNAGEAILLGDRILLQQVLINLLDNAIQAMETVTDRPRRVLIETRRADDTVQIRVTDSGPGFAGDAADRAFDAFYTTKARGTGLGLSISRSTIEAHDGSIGIANNAPDPGGVVTIALPALHAEAS